MVEYREGKPRRSARRSRNGPTIADVASAAGVSPMTVSRVINGEAAVRPATRERVSAAIARLGYVPNAAARSLAGGRQCRLALLYDNPSAAYLSELLVGCLEAVSKFDAQLLVEDCSRQASANAIVRHLTSHRVDAVILPPPLCDNATLLKALSRTDVPAVQLATGKPAATAHAVTIDDHAAARAMTAHLIHQGHRRIGFICGNVNQTASGLRREGHIAALAEAGIPVDQELIVPGDFTYRSGLVAAEQLLALKDRPTAIFASNDDMAAAAIAVAHRHRIEVPQALSVCGFDDTAMAVTIWPELTTIRQPVSEMAARATETLVEAVRTTLSGGTAPIRHEQLTFELVERLSVSPRHAAAKA